ncbi:MAG: ubiquinol-cytochrome C chaperone family protein [Pseudomonadota bacterium]
MSLFRRLFAKPDPQRDAAARLVAAVMTGARQPGLYLKGFAQDDFDGRFQMAALHGGIVMRRLKHLGGDALVVSEKFGEALFDRFDYAYREEGVGDASIARKVRKLGERYFGLARALDDAFDGGDEVADVLARNGLGGEATAGLAQYARAVDAHLATLPQETVFQGMIEWPRP